MCVPKIMLFQPPTRTPLAHNVSSAAACPPPNLQMKGDEDGQKLPFLHETWMDFLYWDTELVKN